MKLFKKIIIWIMISFLFQFSLLFYLEKYYFADSTAIKIQKDTTPVVNKKAEIKIVIPGDAKGTSLSYNGKYLAYSKNGTLFIVNVKSGETNKIEQDKNYEMDLFKWFPDRDMLLITEKSTGKQSKFVFYKYSVGRTDKEVIKGKDHTTPISISIQDKNSTIEDMRMATLNNELYVKIKQTGKRSSIYKVDVNSNLFKVNINSYFIGSIANIPHSENSLVYEDLSQNKIIYANKRINFNIKDVTKPKLLGIDGDDKIYIGNSNDDGISEIYYGEASKPTSTWENIKLREPMQKEDIIITSEDKIYLNDNFHGIIKDAITSLETHYTGQFLALYKGGVASISSDGVLQTKALN